MSRKFYDFAFKLVNSTFKHLNKSQQKNMADLLTAFLFNSSFALWDIASGLSGDTSVKHKNKRLIYFLDTLTIDTQFWKSFCLAVFSLPGFRFKSRKVISLALDATTLKDDFWILAVSVTYQGRSIPILIKSWKGVNENYDYWARVRTTLAQLKSILPKRYQFEILADRGFQGDKMFQLCNELEMDFIVRINDNYRVKLQNGQEYIQLSLFNDGYYPNVSLGKESQTENINVCVNSIETEDGQSRQWFLASNRDMGKEEMVDRYKGRFWIEESFRDVKSKMHWEKYTEKIPNHDRLIKCIVVSSLSYALQVALGNQLDRTNFEKMSTSLFNKFRQTIRRGTQNLEEIILKFIYIIKTYVRRAEYAFA